jgi:hypothetical protein
MRRRSCPRFAQRLRPSLFEPRTLGIQRRETSLRSGDLLDKVLTIRGLHHEAVIYRDRGGMAMTAERLG